MKDDKIFNNSFNRGDIEYELFGQIKIQSETGPDLYDEYIDSKVQEELYEIYQKSPYSKDFEKGRKSGKTVLSEIYYYFEQRLIGREEMSATEKFIIIAEFMNVPYEAMYSELGTTTKEKLLQELDKKYKIFSKKKIKRLF
jgi:hypothetical protein